jgi:hypothetical protein
MKKIICNSQEYFDIEQYFKKYKKDIENEM